MRILLLALAMIPSIATAHSGDATHIHVDSCKIHGIAGHRGTLDCTVPVAQICEGHAVCEVPIGANLAAGVSVPDDAKVTIGYSCGIAHGQSGPNLVDDHATVTMACTMMNSWPESR